MKTADWCSGDGVALVHERVKTADWYSADGVALVHERVKTADWYSGMVWLWSMRE